MTTTRTQDHADQVTSRARAAYEATLAAIGDHGCALDAANEAISEFLSIHSPQTTGMFDSETLTWTFDDA